MANELSNMTHKYITAAHNEIKRSVKDYVKTVSEWQMLVHSDLIEKRIIKYQELKKQFAFYFITLKWNYCAHEMKRFFYLKLVPHQD